MTDILSQLFSSEALVKIMRLFLLNPEEVFDIQEISRRVKVSTKSAGYETRLLSSIDFLKPGVREIEIRFKNKRKPKKKKIKGWCLNPHFVLLHQMKTLVLDTLPIARDKLLRRFKEFGGRLKLITLAGIFLDREDSRIDMMIVGDSISRSRLEKILSSIEADLGKELKYASFSTDEFLYRMSMYDHFIRDILEAPHEKLLNKLDI